MVFYDALNSLGGGRLSTIPEVPSQATSVEEFNKILEEGPLSSSNETSPSFNNKTQKSVNSVGEEEVHIEFVQVKEPIESFNVKEVAKGAKHEISILK